MNHNNTNIAVSAHAIDRLFERVINPEFVSHSTKAEKTEYAESVIRQMFKDSYYLRDVNGTIYFRAYDYKCDLLVRHTTIITLLKVSDKKTRHEKKKAKTEAENAE